MSGALHGVAVGAYSGTRPHACPTGASDSFWGSTSLLVRSSASAVVEETGKTVTVVGSASVTTADFRFGSSAIDIPGGGGGYLTTGNNTVYNFGTGDFTVEAWVKYDNVSANQGTLVRPDGGGGLEFGVTSGGRIYVENQGILRLFTSSSPVVTAGNWLHLAVSRQSTSLRVFLNGSQIDSTVANSTSLTATGTVRIGANAFSGVYDMDGRLDEYRVTKAARYTSNFTPPGA